MIRTTTPIRMKRLRLGIAVIVFNRCDRLKLNLAFGIPDYNTPMSRGRIIFNTLTIMSLLLLLAGAGLWVDSYSSSRGLSYEGLDWLHLTCSDTGRCAILMAETNWGDPPEGWDVYRSDAYGDLEEFCSPYSAGFGGTWGMASHGVDVYALVIPHWFLLLMLAVLPVIWLIKWQKRRRLGPNACHQCAYDLTGNQTGICPECGAGVGTSIGE
jgi:hypothetical protein